MTVKIQIFYLVFISGFINGTEAFHLSIPVGSMMFACGTMFLVGAIVDCVLLVKVFLHCSRLAKIFDVSLGI